MINNTIWFPIVGVLIGVLGFFNWTYSEEAFVPCRGNKPNDRGLRVLVESVYDNNANALASQKHLGLPETPIKGKPADVDVLKCVDRHGLVGDDVEPVNVAEDDTVREGAD